MVRGPGRGGKRGYVSLSLDDASTAVAHHHFLDNRYLVHQLHLMHLNLTIEPGFTFVVEFLLLEGIL